MQRPTYADADANRCKCRCQQMPIDANMHFVLGQGNTTTFLTLSKLSRADLPHGILVRPSPETQRCLWQANTNGQQKTADVSLHAASWCRNLAIRWGGVTRFPCQNYKQPVTRNMSRQHPSTARNGRVWVSRNERVLQHRRYMLPGIFHTAQNRTRHLPILLVIVVVIVTVRCWPRLDYLIGTECFRH